MPYQVTVGLSHGDEFLSPGRVVSDELGAAMLAEHPASLVRILHDDDLCDASCAHDSHAWSAPAPAPRASASALAPAVKTGE